jgi:hypothetical protein
MIREIELAWQARTRLVIDPSGLRAHLNQALFDALIIRDEDVAEAKPAAWVAEVHRLAGSSLGSQAGPKNSPDPAFGGQGFNKAKMVPRAGLEPAPPD